MGAPVQKLSPFLPKYFSKPGLEMPRRPTVATLTKRGLKAKHATLVKQRKGRKISADVFNARVNALFTEQADYSEQKVIQRESNKLIRKIEREDVRESARIRSNAIFNGTINGEDELNTIWKANKGRTLRFTANISNNLRDNVVTLPSTYKEFRAIYLIDVCDKAYDEPIEGDFIVIITDPSPISASVISQAFRAGDTHCVIQPLINGIQDLMEASDSTDTKKRYAKRIQNLTCALEKYDTGVPVSDMEQVAKMAGYKVTIYNIFGKQLYTFNENGKLGLLSFTNTRANHIDEGGMVLSGNALTVSAEEMDAIYEGLKGSNEFFMISGDIKKGLPRRIYTINQVYQLENPNKEYFDELNEQLNIKSYALDAIKFPDVNAFVKEACVINSWVCPLSDEKPTGHLDMPKAYAQFKKCSYYQGFLGMIHQWRSGSFTKEFITEHIGIYRFRVRSCSLKLFQKLGLVSNTLIGTEYTLPSPEILFFIANGVQMDITAGVWGSKFDFEFSDELLQDRRYCEWSGRLGMEYHHNNYSFKCSAEWASHLKSDYGDDVFYWADEGICSIRITNDYIKTTHHILAFITSYVRIQMMEAMMKFKPSQLIKVVMDGLYFKGDTPLGLEWFKPKELREHTGGFGWYAESKVRVNWTACRFAGNTLLTGQGGSGKTYSVLTDKGFNKTLFVCPQHILGAEVFKKYGVSYTTINKLIGAEYVSADKVVRCRPYKEEHIVPAVILIDEVTQISSNWIEKAFELYPTSLIILAGDLEATGQWFQCRNGMPGEYSEIWVPNGVEIIDMPDDRRSRDDELKTLKLRIRAEMRKVYTKLDNKETEPFIINDWAKKMRVWGMANLNPIPLEEASKLFAAGDAWIAGTHSTSKKLLDLGICSGYYKKGGYISDVPLPFYDARGSFTIHSYQGKTLETGKIFISIGDMFEYAMLYTAVSRAVNYSQLVFVV